MNIDPDLDLVLTRTVDVPSPRLTTILPNASGAIRRPCVSTLISKAPGFGTGSWLMMPEATWTLFCRNASTTSPGVMLKLAARSGSSQTRME